MTKRIFRSIFFVAVAVLSITLTVITAILYQHFSDRELSQLYEDTAYIAAGTEAGGTDFLETIGQTDAETRITLIRADGTVLFDSEADTASLENHADREEVRLARENGIGTVTRYSETLSERTIYCAMQLTDGAVIRLSRSYSGPFSLLLGMFQPLLLVGIAAICMSAALAGSLSENIVRPINNLDLEHPNKDSVYPELKPLMARLSIQNRQISAQITELRRKQQEFTSITENMQEGFLIIDSQGNLLSYNSSALHLLKAEAPINGLNLLTIRGNAPVRSSVRQALDGCHNEVMLLDNGRHYRLFANPVAQEEEIIGAVLILLDETEKEQREQLRREFTANVSHELKTPLTSISGFAEIIKSGMVREEDISRFATNIYNEAQRLITLVGDIIKLSQMDENSIPVEPQSVDLYELAQAAFERLQGQAERSGVTLTLKGGHCGVRGVPQILDEMISNLCTNAVKYNRPGGTVTVSVKDTPNGVQISVADTGIGISAADRDRVFERFYRVDKSHSKQIGGTGLGLSIVKHGAAYHGAQLSLESELDVGTTVTLLFPHKN